MEDYQLKYKEFINMEYISGRHTYTYEKAGWGELTPLLILPVLMGIVITITPSIVGLGDTEDSFIANSFISNIYDLLPLILIVITIMVMVPIILKIMGILTGTSSKTVTKLKSKQAIDEFYQRVGLEDDKLRNYLNIENLNKVDNKWFFLEHDVTKIINNYKLAKQIEELDRFIMKL